MNAGAAPQGNDDEIPQKEPSLGAGQVPKTRLRRRSRKAGPVNRPGTGGLCGRKLQIRPELTLGGHRSVRADVHLSLNGVTRAVSAANGLTAVKEAGQVFAATLPLSPLPSPSHRSPGRVKGPGVLWTAGPA